MNNVSIGNYGNFEFEIIYGSHVSNYQPIVTMQKDYKYLIITGSSCMNGGASGLKFSITEPHGERILERNISNGEGSKGYFYIYENVGTGSKVTFGPTWGWGSWFVIGVL